jgi:hypothetical protein
MKNHTLVTTLSFLLSSFAAYSQGANCISIPKKQICLSTQSYTSGGRIVQNTPKSEDLIKAIVLLKSKIAISVVSVSSNTINIEITDISTKEIIYKATYEMYKPDWYKPILPPKDLKASSIQKFNKNQKPDTMKAVIAGLFRDIQITPLQ